MGWVGILLSHLLELSTPGSSWPAIFGIIKEPLLGTCKDKATRQQTGLYLWSASESEAGGRQLSRGAGEQGYERKQVISGKDYNFQVVVNALYMDFSKCTFQWHHNCVITVQSTPLREERQSGLLAGLLGEAALHLQPGGLCLSPAQPDA